MHMESELFFEKDKIKSVFLSHLPGLCSLSVSYFSLQKFCVHTDLFCM